MRAAAERVSVRQVLFATVTPMASIFGSGFLIIVPVLERTLGRWAVLGAAAVCALAWVIGTAVRHCVRVVEPLTATGELDRGTARLERWADAVIVVAYVISVALYLRIMAEYLVGLVIHEGDVRWEKVIACLAVVVIATVGIRRGFYGLELLEKAALAVVFALTFALGLTLLIHDSQELLGDGLSLPPVPDVGLLSILLILGGIVITVQGFETIRYLGDDYDAETRVWASRVAQVVATIVYVLFVAVATPVMGLGTDAGVDNTLLDITRRVAPLLTIPLVISAVLSQFSAATADTAAADGNLRGLWSWMRGPRPYVVGGAAAIVLAATVGTFWIIVIASRAFAAYYALQAIIAFRTSHTLGRRIGYGALAVVMVAITLLAEPAG